MDQDGSDETLYADIVDAIQRAGITFIELWVYYFSIGGTAGKFEVEAYLHGLMPLQPMDRELLAVAVREMYADL